MFDPFAAKAPYQSGTQPAFGSMSFGNPSSAPLGGFGSSQSGSAATSNKKVIFNDSSNSFGQGTALSHSSHFSGASASINSQLSATAKPFQPKSDKDCFGGANTADPFHNQLSSLKTTAGSFAVGNIPKKLTAGDGFQSYGNVTFQDFNKPQTFVSSDREAKGFSGWNQGTRVGGIFGSGSVGAGPDSEPNAGARSLNATPWGKKSSASTQNKQIMQQWPNSSRSATAIGSNISSVGNINSVNDASFKAGESNNLGGKFQGWGQSKPQEASSTMWGNRPRLGSKSGPSQHEDANSFVNDDTDGAAAVNFDEQDEKSSPFRSAQFYRQPSTDKPPPSLSFADRLEQRLFSTPLGPPTAGGFTSHSTSAGHTGAGGVGHGSGSAAGRRMPTSQPICRVCQQLFSSFDELKFHIRRENHHLPAASAATPLGATASTAPTIAGDKNGPTINAQDAVTDYSSDYDIANTRTPGPTTAKMTSFPQTNRMINAHEGRIGGPPPFTPGQSMFAVTETPSTQLQSHGLPQSRVQYSNDAKPLAVSSQYLGESTQPNQHNQNQQYPAQARPALPPDSLKTPSDQANHTGSYTKPTHPRRQQQPQQNQNKRTTATRVQFRTPSSTLDHSNPQADMRHRPALTTPAAPPRTSQTVTLSQAGLNSHMHPENRELELKKQLQQARKLKLNPLTKVSSLGATNEDDDDDDDDDEKEEHHQVQRVIQQAPQSMSALLAQYRAKAEEARSSPKNVARRNPIEDDGVDDAEDGEQQKTGGAQQSGGIRVVPYSQINEESRDEKANDDDDNEEDGESSYGDVTGTGGDDDDNNEEDDDDDASGIAISDDDDDDEPDDEPDDEGDSSDDMIAAEGFAKAQCSNDYLEKRKTSAGMVTRSGTILSVVPKMTLSTSSRLMTTPAPAFTGQLTSMGSSSQPGIASKVLVPSSSVEEPEPSSVVSSSSSSLITVPGGVTPVPGLCDEMCPAEERQKRIDENDVHKLEFPVPFPLVVTADVMAQTMIKKFQRSSADHDLLIPHLIRTPRALYETVRYIEDCIMERHMTQQQHQLSQDHNGGGNDSRDRITNLIVYLFVWDRFRMIAKDFTLQSSALEKDALWVECHERMARWFVLMDHQMKSDADYLGGHAQQNGEQLNNLLKTLDGFYSNPAMKAANVPMPNRGEFVGYYIILQLGNGGEVTKYMQQIEADVLYTPEVQFAIQVRNALKSDNFVRFFSLLRQSNLLQACLMHRYVGQVRLSAIKKLVKGYYMGSRTDVYYPVQDLVRVLMFEDEDDAIEFLVHCGLEINFDDPDEGPAVLLANQHIMGLLPRDKNDHPIFPSVRAMIRGIDADKRGSLHIYDVSRGLATNSVMFDDKKHLTSWRPQLKRGASLVSTVPTATATVPMPRTGSRPEAVAIKNVGGSVVPSTQPRLTELMKPRDASEGIRTAMPVAPLVRTKPQEAQAKTKAFNFSSSFQASQAPKSFTQDQKPSGLIFATTDVPAKGLNTFKPSTAPSFLSEATSNVSPAGKMTQPTLPSVENHIDRDSKKDPKKGKVNFFLPPATAPEVAAVPSVELSRKPSATSAPIDHVSFAFTKPAPSTTTAVSIKKIDQTVSSTTTPSSMQISLRQPPAVPVPSTISSSTSIDNKSSTSLPPWSAPAPQAPLSVLTHPVPSTSPSQSLSSPPHHKSDASSIAAAASAARTAKMHKSLETPLAGSTRATFMRNTTANVAAKISCARLRTAWSKWLSSAVVRENKLAAKVQALLFRRWKHATAHRRGLRHNLILLMQSVDLSASSSAAQEAGGIIGDHIIRKHPGPPTVRMYGVSRVNANSSIFVNRGSKRSLQESTITTAESGKEEYVEKTLSRSFFKSAEAFLQSSLFANTPQTHRILHTFFPKDEVALARLHQRCGRLRDVQSLVNQLLGHNRFPEGPVSPLLRLFKPTSSPSTGTLLAVNPVSLVAPALFRTQSGCLRAAYGFPDASIVDASVESGPVWAKELFWKVAVCNSATAAGMWCDADNLLINILRTALVAWPSTAENVIKDHPDLDDGPLSRGLLGKWRQVAPCHVLRNGNVINRVVNAAVVDLCAETCPSRETDNELTSLSQGVQAVLITVDERDVLSSYEDTASPLSRAVHALSDAITLGAPVAFIICQTVSRKQDDNLQSHRDDLEVSWEKLTAQQVLKLAKDENQLKNDLSPISKAAAVIRKIFAYTSTSNNVHGPSYDNQQPLYESVCAIFTLRCTSSFASNLSLSEWMASSLTSCMCQEIDPCLPGPPAHVKMVEECMRCLSSALTSLAECTPPFPLLVRVHPAEQLETQLTESLLRSPPNNLETSKHSSSTAMLSDAIAIVNDTVSKCVHDIHDSAARATAYYSSSSTLSNGLVGTLFPAADFALTKRSQERNSTVSVGSSPLSKTSNEPIVPGVLMATSSELATASAVSSQNLSLARIPDIQAPHSCNFLPVNWCAPEAYIAAAASVQQLALPELNAPTTCAGSKGSPEYVRKYFEGLNMVGWTIATESISLMELLISRGSGSSGTISDESKLPQNKDEEIEPNQNVEGVLRRLLSGLLRQRIHSLPKVHPIYLFAPLTSYQSEDTTGPTASSRLPHPQSLPSFKITSPFTHTATARKTCESRPIPLHLNYAAAIAAGGAVADAMREEFGSTPSREHEDDVFVSGSSRSTRKRGWEFPTTPTLVSISSPLLPFSMQSSRTAATSPYRGRYAGSFVSPGVVANKQGYNSQRSEELQSRQHALDGTALNDVEHCHGNLSGGVLKRYRTEEEPSREEFEEAKSCRSYGFTGGKEEEEEKEYETYIRYLETPSLVDQSKNESENENDFVHGLSGSGYVEDTEEQTFSDDAVIEGLWDNIRADQEAALTLQSKLQAALRGGGHFDSVVGYGNKTNSLEAGAAGFGDHAVHGDFPLETDCRRLNDTAGVSPVTPLDTSIYAKGESNGNSPVMRAEVNANDEQQVLAMLAECRKERIAWEAKYKDYLGEATN